MNSIARTAQKIVAILTTEQERDQAWCDLMVEDFYHNGRPVDSDLKAGIQSELRRVDPDIATRPARLRQRI